MHDHKKNVHSLFKFSEWLPLIDNWNEWHPLLLATETLVMAPLTEMQWQIVISKWRFFSAILFQLSFFFNFSSLKLIMSWLILMELCYDIDDPHVVLFLWLCNVLDGYGSNGNCNNINKKPLNPCNKNKHNETLFSWCLWCVGVPKKK